MKYFFESPPPHAKANTRSFNARATHFKDSNFNIYLLFCISYTGKIAGHQKGSRVSLLCCNAKYTSTRYMK